MEWIASEFMHLNKNVVYFFQLEEVFRADLKAVIVPLRLKEIGNFKDESN